MNPQQTRKALVVAVFCAAAIWTTFAANAEATCVTSPSKNQFAATSLRFAERTASAAGERDGSDARDRLVGMWTAEFRVGSALFDQTFQQFHSDGTENILSNGLPPVLGNICIGLWKQIGPRTFKLRHVAWNWDTEGHFTGLFEMFVTLTIDRQGNTYSGTFVADSYDTSNNVIPDLHVEGVVRATRMTVD